MEHTETVAGEQWTTTVASIPPLGQLLLAHTYECAVLIFLYVTYFIY